MNGGAHTPVSLCVGCGARAPQAALLRFCSTADGALALVAPRSLRGRTAYLHPQPECWQRFAARGGRLRAVGRNIDKAQRLAFVQGLKAAEHSAMVKEDGAQTHT